MLSPEPMTQPQLATIFVPLSMAQDRDPVETGRLYLYLDESTIPVGSAQMFGVGGLLTTTPVGPEIINRAMDALRSDPERGPSSAQYTPLRARLDEKTLARGHFHASEDSANAHSPFARVISECVTGNFVFSFSELRAGTDSAAYRRHALRSLHTLLPTRRPVACVFERRTDLSVEAARALLEEMRDGLDPCAFDLALMRSYYPQISVAIGDKSDPGIQVADMLLWSIGQELFSTKQTRVPWAARCGLYKWADAAIPEAPMRWVQCRVNNRNPLFAHEPDDMVPYPVSQDELIAADDPLTVANCYAAAERILRRVAVRPLPPHAEHLRGRVADALRMLEKPERVGPDEIRQVARAFIRVFDTVPIYNGMVRDRAHPQWLPYLRAKRFLGLTLRTDVEQGQQAAEYLANLRRANVEEEPEVYGIHPS